MNIAYFYMTQVVERTTIVKTEEVVLCDECVTNTQPIYYTRTEAPNICVRCGIKNFTKTIGKEDAV